MEKYLSTNSKINPYQYYPNIPNIKLGYSQTQTLIDQINENGADVSITFIGLCLFQKIRYIKNINFAQSLLQ